MFTLKNLLSLILRNAIISLAVVLATSLGVIFLAGQIKHLSDSVATNHHLEAELQKRAGLFELLKRDAQIVGTNDSIINGAFASSDNILGFINAFDALASKNSLTQTYTFETPVVSAIPAPFPINTIAYTNRFEASVSDLSGYIMQFNKLPYYTKIDGINISSQDKLGWNGPSTIMFHATLYTRGAQ